jgi:hypothetical protein
MSFNTRTHRAYEYSLIGAHGDGRGPFVARVHSSRICENCTHYGPHDFEWNRAVAAGEELAKCMNDCWAADAEDPENRFCPDHQSWAEFDGFVHRPHRPVLMLAKARE